ncbi:MAG: nucleotidyltransferase family protein [Candidatus Hodarchaeota archaeon]
MKAVILCAGIGNRMKPYTEIYQKTMIPLQGKPLLEYILNGIKAAGFNDFIIVVGYLKEQVINYFQDGSKWDVNIEYINQNILNGTGGALLLCEDLINTSHFFLTWGDILVPYSVYKKVYDIYKHEKHDFILVANYLDDPFKGAAVYCVGDFCCDIIEKPPIGRSISNLNNCGVFIFSKEIFEVLKKVKPSERGEIEIPEAICVGIKERNWKVRVLKMEKNQVRGDFGDINVYEQLKEDSNWLNKMIE